MRKRRLPPRTDIPDWRDPNMPLLQKQQNALGEVRYGLVKPEVAQRQSQRQIIISRQKKWDADPTYDLKANRRHDKKT